MSKIKNNTPKQKKGIFKYITLKTLIIALVLCLFNSYAWFIYATKASLNLTAHVSSWNISFQADNQSTTNIIVDVGNIYPGMKDFTKVVTVSNGGEVKAKLSYKYKKMILFGNTYEIGSQYTEEQLKNKIETEYPFKVTVKIDQDNLENGTGSGSFTINISWPYESGNDETDTYWGSQAYDYYKNNGSTGSLYIEIELAANEI